MSTVVFRDGVLAADTLLVQGTIRCPESMNKLIIGRSHPVIYAMAGKIAALSTTVRMIEAMALAPWDGGSFASRPPIYSQSELVVFHRNGRIICFEADGLWYEPAAVPFMALGSGSKAALAAMHMGADAVQAVEIAHKVDAFTGGGILTVSLDEIPIGAKDVDLLETLVRRAA